MFVSSLGIDISLPALSPSTFALLGLISACLIISRTYGYRKTNLPPGPAGLPLVGNLFQITRDAWLTFTEWRKTYGSLIYITVIGKGILIINDHNTAADLLSRRANVYSGRPRWIVANEIMCGGLFGVFVQPSEVWRSMRRAAHESAKPTAAEAYCPLQQKYAVWLTRKIMNSPHEWETYLRRATTETAVKFTYGSQGSIEPTAQRFSNFIERVIWAATPGSYLVDFFTWMNHLPKVLAPWKRKAQAQYEVDNIYFTGLYRNIKRYVDNGEDVSCIAATIANQQEQCKLDDTEASWLAMTLCVAGTDTTAASMMWLVLALSEFPEVQKRAQQELKEVVGYDRVPSFNDRPSLPYIEAIVREALRYRPMVPLGIPHVTTEDDVYNGYFIPAGTICLPNIWAMNHNTDIYGPDANEFNPGRHLDAKGHLKTFELCPDGHVTFVRSFFKFKAQVSQHCDVCQGFGKRICIGRHVAQNAMFIEVATLLWALTLEPLRDAEGKPRLPSLDQSLFEGLLVRPLRFVLNAKPVFPEAYSVLTGALESMEGE